MAAQDTVPAVDPSGVHLGAALATVVGLLVEVPVTLSWATIMHRIGYFFR